MLSHPRAAGVTSLYQQAGRAGGASTHSRLPWVSGPANCLASPGSCMQAERGGPGRSGVGCAAGAQHHDSAGAREGRAEPGLVPQRLHAGQRQRGPHLPPVGPTHAQVCLHPTLPPVPCLPGAPSPGPPLLLLLLLPLLPQVLQLLSGQLRSCVACWMQLCCCAEAGCAVSLKAAASVSVGLLAPYLHASHKALGMA